jgi:uncharacterized protein
MRLQERELQVITETVKRADPEARLFLFGSRVDDHQRGGDIDVLCISRVIDGRQRRRIRRAILDQIGDQKLDLIVEPDAKKSFVRLILPDAKELTNDGD